MMGALPSYAVQGWVQSQAQTREVLRSYTGHPLNVQYSTVQNCIVIEQQNTIQYISSNYVYYTHFYHWYTAQH